MQYQSPKGISQIKDLVCYSNTLLHWTAYKNVGLKLKENAKLLTIYYVDQSAKNEHGKTAEDVVINNTQRISALLGKLATTQDVQLFREGIQEGIQIRWHNNEALKRAIFWAFKFHCKRAVHSEIINLILAYNAFPTFPEKVKAWPEQTERQLLSLKQQKKLLNAEGRQDDTSVQQQSGLHYKIQQYSRTGMSYIQNLVNNIKQGLCKRRFQV